MIVKRIKALPTYYLYPAIGGLIVGIFTVSYWPQEVTFSYQSPTCVNQLHVAPGVLKTDSSLFQAESAAEQKINSASVFAKKICFIPQTVPKPGDYRVAVTLWGLPFIQKVFTVRIASHPVVSAVQLKDPIPVSKKLIVALSSTDVVFSYYLRVADRKVLCEQQPLGVGCDIKKLGLEQGSKYEMYLDRYFNDKKVATVLETQIETLKATNVVTSSIKDGETVFAKPTSMTIQFDKPIREFSGSLIKVGDGKPLEITQSIKDSVVTLSWPEDLSRQQSYSLELSRVQATDGSMLPDKTSISFKTSGGPLVKDISIGTYKVPLGTTATITFDQPLLDGQDIGKQITVSGGAKIVGYKGQNVTVSFANVPRCTDVVIKIGDSLESSYGVKGGSVWQYTTRTVCQSVVSIGRSVKGRAISAYIFGSGAKKVVYTGMIHGDETSTRSLMLRWIDALEASPGQIPSDKTVIVIPTINPDGYAAGTRTNAHNVDLNRNFATNDWRKDITTVNNQPFPGGGGESPLSEPESLAIANYIAGLRPTLVLSYHSIGGLVAANQIGTSTQLAKRYADLSGYSNSTGSSDAFDYTVSGTADDYYGQVLGVPSILVELGSHTYHQFEKNKNAMWAMVK